MDQGEAFEMVTALTANSTKFHLSLTTVDGAVKVSNCRPRRDDELKEDDTILSIDGKKVKTAEDAMQALDGARDSSHLLEICRGDGRVQEVLTIRIGEQGETKEVHSSMALPSSQKQQQPSPLLAQTPSSSSEGKEQEQEQEQEEQRMSEALQLKDEGNQSFKEGKFEEAIASFSRAIELAGSNAPYTFFSNRAAAYLQVGKAGEGLEDCNACILLNRNFPKAHYRRGQALLELQRLEEAVLSFTTARSLEPDNVQTLGALTRAQEMLRKMQEKRNCPTPAPAPVSAPTPPAPTPAEAIEHAGASRERAGGRSKSQAIPAAGKKLWGDDGGEEEEGKLKEEGKKAFERGDYTEAASCFTASLNLNPDDHTLLASRSAALLQLGKLEEALEDAEESVKRCSSYAEGFLRKAQALSVLGRLDLAAEAAAEAEKRDPEDLSIRATCERMRRVREGGTLFAEGVESISEEEIEVEVEVPKQGKEGDHVTVSISFPELGAVKLDAVVPPGKRGGEKFRLKLGRRENIADKKKLEGIKAFKGGRMQKACEDFSSSILLNPTDPASFLNRSAANFNLGRLEASLQDADSYLLLQPHCPRGLHRRGLALAALGEFEKAVFALEEALELAEGDEEIKKDLEEAKENAEKRRRGETVSYERIQPDARKESKFLHHRVAAEVEEELQEQWRKSERRRKERESREIERAAAITNEKLAAELARAKEEEEHKRDTERAKFQAVAQRVEFEQFEQNVKGASLKPQRTKTDGKEHGIILTPGSSAAIPGLAKKCFNAMAEAGDRRSWWSGGGEANKHGAGGEAPSHRTSSSSDSPPSNGRDFLRRWKALKGRDEEQKQLLLCLPPNPFPGLFKTEMDADLITEIISLLTRTEHEAKFGFGLLESVTKTQRFSLISRFLSRKDKDDVQMLLDGYQEKHNLPEDDISTLKKLFV